MGTWRVLLQDGKPQTELAGKPGDGGSGGVGGRRNKGKNGVRVICTWQEHLVKEEVQCVFLHSVYERDLHTRAFVGPRGILAESYGLFCFPG